MTPEEVAAMRARYRRRCELLELQLADVRAHVEVERKLADDLGRLLTTAGGWLTFDTPVRVRYRISACLNAWRTTRGDQQ